MAPKKLIHKSRNVGGEKKRRGRPPKSQPETAPTPQAADTPVSDATPQSPPVVALAPANGSNGSNGAVTKAQPYTGLSQVPHGLNLPTFDVNQYFASDLFSNSSTLPETEKEDADKTVESIEKKRQTVRVVAANIGLNQDIVRVGNDYLKLEGLAIDYGTTQRNNATKFVNYQTAGVNTEIAVNHYDQAQERLTQGRKVLAGMRSITPLIDDEWNQRRDLKQSQIKSLQVMAIQAKQALEPKVMQLSQEFRQEVESLN
jgi:hypothetical protein